MKDGPFWRRLDPRKPVAVIARDKWILLITERCADFLKTQPSSTISVPIAASTHLKLVKEDVIKRLFEFKIWIPIHSDDTYP